jgi:hypothetical protein
MPSPNYENRIRVAMVKVFELDGDYRCERDLHHHLTALFDSISPMRIGQKDTLVRYEKPTKGSYQWKGDSPSSGNIDIVFLTNGADQAYWNPPEGIAVEVNCNYPSTTKIKQDLIKLLDPDNSFAEAVYVVVGTEQVMMRPVELGCEEAIAYLTPQRNDRPFPLMRILLVEELGGWRFLYEGSLNEDGSNVKITWNELKRRCLLCAQAESDPMRLISKEEAKRFLNDRMRVEHIPLFSTVACCMFEPTFTSDGRQICHFGKAPLWDHVLELKEDQVPYVVFSHWLDRLVKYGRGHQGR